MKKNNRRAESNQVIGDVTVSLSESKLLKSMVQELARFRQTEGFESEKAPEGWKSIESSSLEAYVSGDISVMVDGENVRPLFVASFLFTCVRPQEENYQLRWMNSLS